MLLFGFAIQAQQAPAELTLSDALKYALENKAEARKARLDTENAEYQIQEVRSRALPQISANGNLTYNPILQLNAIDVGAFSGGASNIQLVPLGQDWSAVGGVTLTQAIFDQAVFTGLRAAKTTREFYRINQQLTEEQVIERVANSYYEVYVQREQLAVMDSTYANTSRVLDVIRGQFENGLAKEIDLDRIRVNLSNIDTQRQQLRNAVQLAENALKFYMGMSLDVPIRLPENEFEVTPQVLEENPDVSKRTEFQLLSTQTKLLTLERSSIKAAYYPTLSFSAGYNYIAQGPNFPLGATAKDNVYWSDFSTLSLNLNIPIFNGFGTRSRVRMADVRLEKNREDLKDLELSLNLEHANARTQITNSLITINNQRENVLLARKVLENTQNNYYNGLAQLTEVLDTENAYVAARNNYNTALLQYKRAEIQLIKSKGQLKSLTQ